MQAPAPAPVQNIGTSSPTGQTATTSSTEGGSFQEQLAQETSKANSTKNTSSQKNQKTTSKPSTADVPETDTVPTTTTTNTTTNTTESAESPLTEETSADETQLFSGVEAPSLTENTASQAILAAQTLLGKNDQTAGLSEQSNTATSLLTDAATEEIACAQKYTITSTGETNIYDLTLGSSTKIAPVEGVIEHWSATYTTDLATQNTASSTSTVTEETGSVVQQNSTPLAEAATKLVPNNTQQPVPLTADEDAVLPSVASSTEPLTDQLGNNTTITVYQSSDEEELASRMIPGATNASQKGGQRMDVNSNYIHTNIESKSLEASMAQSQEQSFTDEQKGQQNTQSQFSAEQLKTENTILQNESLNFLNISADGKGILTGQISSTTSQTSSVMTLPSGTIVPEETAMDQVIERLTNNTRLESGSIRMRLYPQELGELRMEIEVKQDNIKAHITTQNLQAQEALDKHLPRLREALAEQGLELNEVEITVAAGEQNEGFHFQQNEDRHQLGKMYRTNTIESDNFVSSTDEEDTSDLPQNQDQLLSVVA